MTIATKVARTSAVLLALMIGLRLGEAGPIQRACKMLKDRGTECVLTCGAPRGDVFCDAPMDQCRSECGTFGPADFPASVLSGLTRRRPVDLPASASYPDPESASEAMVQFVATLKTLAPIPTPAPIPASYVALFFAPLKEPIKFVSVSKIDRDTREAPTAKDPFIVAVFEMFPASWDRLRQVEPKTLIEQTVAQVRVQNQQLQLPLP
jgi:hypothetical protein